MKTEETITRQCPSDAALQHEREALALYRFIAAEHGGSEEAEALRDEMTSSWDAMAPSEQVLLRGLYRDLHMLTGNEILDAEPVDPTELKKAMQGKHFELGLALLRKRRDKLELPHVAYFRSQCWNELGYHHAGLAFIEHATNLNPDNANCTYLFIVALLDLGRWAAAVAKAAELEAQTNAKAPALFGAAHALLRAAQAGKHDESGTYERITKLLVRAIALESAQPPEAQSTSLIVQGYLETGLCYEHLNQLPHAVEAYTAALHQDPDNDAALVARGLAQLESDPQAAERDFESAVHLNTPIVWPYMELAPRYLKRGEYEACIKLCDMAIRKTTAPEHLANLFEWLAIAHACLMSNPTIVNGYFQKALNMDPLSKRIRYNLEEYQVAYSLKSLGPGFAATAWDVANDVSPADARASHSHSVFDRGQPLLAAA